MAKTFIDLNEEYDQNPWLVDYDGDMDETRRRLEYKVSTIEDPEERLLALERLLNAREYNEYFAYNPQFKSEDALIEIRMSMEEYIEEDFNNFVYHLLRCNMNNNNINPDNILFVSENNKFTFLNRITDVIAFHLADRGRDKMRREYENHWTKEDEDVEIMVIPMQLKRPY